MTRNGEPPYWLTLYRQCKSWGTLPEAGGLLDQDDKLMQQIQAAKDGEMLYEIELLKEKVNGTEDVS